MIIISCVSPELEKRAKTKKTSGREDDDDAYDFERIERRDEEEVDDDDNHDDFPEKPQVSLPLRRPIDRWRR